MATSETEAGQIPTLTATPTTYTGVLLDQGGAVFNVAAYPPANSNDWAPAFESAQGAGQAVVVPAGTYPIASDLTLSAQVTFEPGAVLQPAANVTVTITGRVYAGQWQIFDGSPGSVVFAAVAPNGNPVPPPEVWVDWFGAKADQSADASAAINAAIAALPTAASGLQAGSTLVFGCGAYLVEAPLTEITGNVSVIVRGAGIDMTRIIFDTPAPPSPPSSPLAEGGSVLFTFTSNSGVELLWRCGITDLSIWCYNADDTRTAIYCGQVRNFTIRNVLINFQSGDDDSIGLHLLGRDESTVSDVYLYAARPIVVSLFSGTAESGLDHWCFTNMVIYNLLNAGSTNGGLLIPPQNPHPLVEVEPGCALTNVVFTGKQVWVGGAGAFLWDNGGVSPERESTEVVFENIRWESGGFQYNAQPAAFQVTPYTPGEPTNVQHVTFKNVVCGAYATSDASSPAYQTGFYLRNVREATFNSVTVEGNVPGQNTGTAFDIDDSCDSVLLLNFGTDDVGPPNVGSGLAKVFSAGLPSSSGLNATEQIQYYSNVSSGNAPNLSFLGQYVYAQSGTLPNGAPLSITLPAFSIAQLFLAYYGPGGTGGGQILSTGAATVLLSGSGVYTSQPEPQPAPGVAVYMQSGSSSTIYVENTTGDDVTISGIIYYVPTSPVN